MLSTRDFAVLKDEKTFMQEISVLQHSRQAWRMRWENFEDNKVGITLRSHVTGKTAQFYLGETVKNSDGDTVEWQFFPYSDTKEGAQLTGWKVRILND